MPPPPPPPPAFGPPKAAPLKVGGGAPDRGALLSSIQQGAKLKKAVTNDRSTPIIDGKVKSSTNGSINSYSGGGGGGIPNGGAPQLAGLFAGGMPKLKPTGRTRVSDETSESSYKSSSGPPSLPYMKKPSAPSTPNPIPKSTPTFSQMKDNSMANNNLHEPFSNGYLPPSPKPSSKSSPAPPPPPSNRKPSLPDRGGGRPFLDIPKHSSPYTDLTNATPASSDEKHPPLPAKPSLRLRIEPGSRAPPPRPPSASKPVLPPKSPDLKPNGDGLFKRTTSIDRSKSMREPAIQNHYPQMRVGTSAESPAAPYRPSNNHREAPPVPTVRPPMSKTVGRAAGSKMSSALRPPTEKPPKPPVRPMVAAPPPPSQPPPPPPPVHRAGPPPPPSGGKPEISSIKESVPPPPPERNESTRSSRQTGDFEGRFSNVFKSRHQFPLPLTMNNMPKTYPSKSNVKNQRRAPQPPTIQPPSLPPSSKSTQSLHQSGYNNNNTMYPPVSKGYASHNVPPPPPPHAPLHLQLDRKFYGAEASHC